MTESLAELVSRVSAFERRSVPEESRFGHPRALSEKVDPGSGRLREFFGSTVIAALSQRDCPWIGALRDDLHRRMGHALAEPLHLSTMHPTICDLRSSVDVAEVSGAVFQTLDAVEGLVAQAKGTGAIRWKAHAVFNLMNTSVALGLVPATEEDHERMVRLRRLFESFTGDAPYTPPM